ncbi:hypothetical protein N7507_011320 [Penicillium longicatenatum]|nr:hypothetical protein N7507_011320 [Penicillium longicatenatum]
MPATDLIGTLDQIEKRAAGESYKNHWEFDTDVRNMIGSAYDGHLDVSTCPSSLMTYTKDVPLVSVSSNGMAIPKVYTFVLALPSFEPEDLAQFNNLARNFIKKAAKEGKKRMIIDLQGNGGGAISAGWNLFRLFFPDQEVYSATRFRAHEGINFIGEAFARVPLNNPDTYGNMLDWKENVTPDQEAAFSSWADLYGPHELLGVNSSSLFANNLTAISYPGVEPVSGYGAIPLDPKKTFAAEDIILISDGHCASTCTLFTELMKAQGARSITFGGRPLAAPMQAMGGIKGAQVENLADMANLLAVAKELAKSSSLLSDEDLEKLGQMSNATGNLLNAFGPTNDIVPRQFIYEAAECRRFFTFENIVDQETTWASAADAMFYGGGYVEGSMNGPGSLIPASA